MHTKVSLFHIYITLLADNTIRISQWNKEMKSDRSLLDCLEIISQLNSNQLTDVTKDLQYIMDMKDKYRQ